MEITMESLGDRLEAWSMAQWAPWGIEYLGMPIVVLTTAMAKPKSPSAMKNHAGLKSQDGHCL